MQIPTSSSVKIIKNPIRMNQFQNDFIPNKQLKSTTKFRSQDRNKLPDVLEVHRKAKKENDDSVNITDDEDLAKKSKVSNSIP